MASWEIFVWAKDVSPHFRKLFKDSDDGEGDGDNESEVADEDNLYEEIPGIYENSSHKI